MNPLVIYMVSYICLLCAYIVSRFSRKSMCAAEIFCQCLYSHHIPSSDLYDFN